MCELIDLFGNLKFDVPCNRADCSNHGECIGTDLSPQCYCDIPYSGRRCELAPCDSATNCNGRGQCVTSANGQPTCTCNSGFRGSSCQHIKSTGNNNGNGNNNGFPFGNGNGQGGCSIAYCNNHGLCAMGADNQFACQCASGYSGSRCETAGNIAAATSLQNTPQISPSTQNQGTNDLNSLIGSIPLTGLSSILSGTGGTTGLNGLSSLSGLRSPTSLTGLGGISGINSLSNLYGLSSLSSLSSLGGLSGISGLSGLTGMSGISGLSYGQPRLHIHPSGIGQGMGLGGFSGFG